MSYHYGKFVWFEHVSHDIDKARAFYEQLFGWQSPGEPIGDQVYHMIHNQGAGIGGFRTAAADVPSHWFSYLSVADVDATAAAITQAHGVVTVPPTDFPPVGRGCFFNDPQGAALSAWHSTGGDRPDADAGVLNDWYWNELLTSDDQAAVAFYQQVFGYDSEDMAMPDGGQYHVMKRDGIARGGIMRSPQPDSPSFWMPYVLVADCDQCADHARNLGAQIIVAPLDIPNVGRIAMMQDPTGAFLGFMHAAVMPA